ncbi:MAG: hypothetical protein HYV17_10215 [Xanthomonadales bacterium]|nr:hypothetical protein [Xanthomonadales bacterium]
MSRSADSTQQQRTGASYLVLLVLLGLAILGVREAPPADGPSQWTLPPRPHTASARTAGADFARHELARRLPVGAQQLPVGYRERALAAAQSMPRHATARQGEHAKQAASWSWLGPRDVGGRMRTLLFDPRNPQRLLAGGVSGGVWESDDRGRHWQALSDDAISLNIGALVMAPGEPDLIYAGTGELYRNNDIPYAAMGGAGILRSRDGGRSFQQLLATANDDFRYVADIAVSAIDPARIYAATNTGLWRSRDAGAHWQQILRPANPNGDRYYEGCTELQLLPEAGRDVLLAACASRSLDDRYYQPGTLLPPACIGPCPAAVFRNDDAAGDAPWQNVLQESGMGRTSLAFAPSNPRIVYALAASIVAGFDRTGDGGGDYDNGLHALFRSEDAGRTWSARLRNDSGDALSTYLLSYADGFDAVRCGFGATWVYSAGWYNQALAVNPENPDVVWAAGMELYRSDDGGRSFGKASYHWLDGASSAGVHADQHYLVYPPDYGPGRRELFVTNDGGVAMTADDLAPTRRGADASCGPGGNGMAWETRESGLGTTQVYAGSVSADGAVVLAGLQDNGTHRGRCLGSDCSWSEIRGGDGGYNAIDPRSNHRLYTSYQGVTIARSEDGGDSHVRATSGISDSVHFIMPYLIDPSAPDRLYAAGTRLWRSDDRGGLWRSASARVGTAFADRISAIAVAARDPNRMLLGNQNRILRNHAALASNAGTAWAASSPRPGWVSSLAFAPDDARVAYATYSTLGGGAHVWRSGDGGSSWSALNGESDGRLPDVPVHSIAIDPADPRRLYLGTDIGVFVSLDGGQHWAAEFTGFASAITEQLVIRPATANEPAYLYAFTYGRGAWRVPLAQLDGAPSYRIGADLSGSFYDPAQSGQGFVLEPILVDGVLQLSAAWYTYADGQPLWLFGAGAADGDRVQMTLYSARGADFPPRFAPGAVQIEPFGTLELQFSSASVGRASWTTTRPGFASGSMPLQRLLASIGADGRTGRDGIAACHVGSWYQPMQSGHGLSIDVHAIGTQRLLAAAWYVYLDGAPLWLVGTGEIAGDHADLTMYRTEGTGFGSAFDPNAVRRIAVGNLRFTTTGAATARIDWQFNESRLGSGSLELVQLARVLGRDCGA